MGAMSLLWEVSVIEFVLVTVALGGGLAYMVGRSTALTWSGWGLMIFYTLLVTGAARFIHFSLFGGTFFLPFETIGIALYYTVIDFIVLLAFAALGRSWTRRLQTERQYGFLTRA